MILQRIKSDTFKAVISAHLIYDLDKFSYCKLLAAYCIWVL